MSAMTEKPDTCSDAREDAEAFEELKQSANAAEMTSSPALNDDADTDSGGAGDQTLPEGNRFKN